MRRGRHERRDDRGMFEPRADAIRYQMHEQLMSIGDDFWIENAAGERVFRVNGKALRVRQTLTSVSVAADAMAGRGD